MKTSVRLFAVLFLSNLALADVTFTEYWLTCTAQWSCEGESEPKGTVSSDKSFPKGKEAECTENLGAQIRATGLCSTYIFVPDTLKHDLKPVERTMWTETSGQGESLVVGLNRFNRSFSWNCTGSACYDVWRNQSNEMDNILDWWKTLERKQALLSPVLATRVRDSARKMCRQEYAFSSGDDWATFMTNKLNATGVAMYNMQLRGRIEERYRCKMILR